MPSGEIRPLVSIPPEARKEFALTVLGPGVYVLLVEAEIAEEDRFQGASGDLYDLVWEETDRSGPIVPEEAPHVHSNCGH